MSSNNNNLGVGLIAFVSGMVVWAMFGDRIKKGVNQNQTYQDMKSQVMSRLEGLSQMSEGRYHQIVDEVGSSYAKAKGITQNEVQDLVSDLKFHWAKIKNRWNEKDEPPRTIADQNMYDGFNNRF